MIYIIKKENEIKELGVSFNSQNIQILDIENIDNLNLESTIIFINFRNFLTFFQNLNELQKNIFNKNNNKYIFSLEEIYTKHDIEIFKYSLINNLINGYILPTQEAFFNLSSKAYGDEIAFKEKIYIGTVGLNQNPKYIETDHLFIIPLIVNKDELFYNLKYNFTGDDLVKIGILLSNESIYSLEEINNDILKLNKPNIEIVSSYNPKPKLGYLFPFNNFRINYSKIFFEYIYQTQLPIFSLNSGVLNELNIYDENKKDNLYNLFLEMNNYYEYSKNNKRNLSILSWENSLNNILNWINFKETEVISKEIIDKDYKLFKFYNRHYNNYGQLFYDYY